MKIVIIALFLALATPALAVDNVNVVTQPAPVVKPLGQGKMLVSARAQAKIDLITRRLENALVRIESLSDRVSSRIAKMKEAGRDVSQAEAKFAEASAALATAKSAVAAFTIQASTAINGEGTLGAKVTSLRQLVTDTAAKVKAAHQSLVAVITELKVAAGVTQ